MVEIEEIKKVWQQNNHLFQTSPRKTLLPGKNADHKQTFILFNTLYKTCRIFWRARISLVSVELSEGGVRALCFSYRIINPRLPATMLWEAYLRWGIVTTSRDAKKSVHICITSHVLSWLSHLATRRTLSIYNRIATPMDWAMKHQHLCSLQASQY